MDTVYSFPPIYSKNSKILILGSVPSVASRANNFSYSHKSNRFCKIFSSLFNIKLNSIKEKTNFLINNNIALWNTIKECKIYKSKDSSIQDVIVNDIKSLIDITNIKHIYVIGLTALKIYNKYIKDSTKIEAKYLPCPSSANATYSLDKLIKEYSVIMNNL